MKTASVVELKTHLGHYLGLVARGERIVVTSHRHAVACLVQQSEAPETVRITMATCPASDLDRLAPVHLSKPVDGLRALMSDRQRR